MRDLHGAVLGGTFSAEPFAYALATDEADIHLQMTAIDLAHVLALEGDDVQGSGLLDGRLPIQMSGDVLSVVDGNLAARAPGGTLVYKGAASSALAAQSGMGFVFQALEDFRYDVLDAKVKLMQTQINLLRQTGKLEQWLKAVSVDISAPAVQRKH